MDYRNDRDALRSEVDTLQQELETARHDQERLAGLEQQLAKAQRDLAKAEGELARRDPARPPRRRGVFLIVALAAVFLAAVGVGFFLLRVPAAPPIPDDVPAPPARPPLPPRVG